MPQPEHQILLPISEYKRLIGERKRNLEEAKEMLVQIENILSERGISAIPDMERAIRQMLQLADEEIKREEEHARGI
jgi:hypothetical protein